MGNLIRKIEEKFREFERKSKIPRPVLYIITAVIVFNIAVSAFIALITILYYGVVFLLIYSILNMRI